MKILAVDDDPAILKLLTRYLESKGVEVLTAETTREVSEIMTRCGTEIDVVLLDLLLPDVYGFELLEKLRKEHGTGVIIMTGNHDVTDRVVGLELGADDYIQKPFELREVLARLRTVNRRISENRKTNAPDVGEDNNLTFNGWRYDLASGLLVSPDSERVGLTTHERKLLGCFMDAGNRVLSRQELSRCVFSRDWLPGDRGIDILVSKLRKKIRDRDVILNDRNVGYKFSPLIRRM